MRPNSNNDKYQPRRKIGFFLLIVIGVAIGFAIKNVEVGLVIGVVLGLLAGGLVSKGKE